MRHLKRSMLFLSLILGLMISISAKAASLELVPEWGATGVPADMEMYVYVPDTVVDNPPVLVLLHYWGGGASGVFAQANAGGLVAAADKYGFIMVVPETTDCWDYGSTQSLTRDGGGQTQGIAQMVDYAVAAYGANSDRVYVTGDSCGGMMTLAMLAVYPDMFKAGTSFCGVTVGGQWDPVNRTAQQWGDIVRNINPDYTGPYPRVQLFHGTADQTVNYSNHTQSIMQWTNVMGLSSTPDNTVVRTISGSQWTRETWKDDQGFTLIDAWTQAGGTHDIGLLFNARYIVPILGLDRHGDQDSKVSIPRGRPRLNPERTTFVADNGERLRGPYYSTEWTGATTYEEVDKMKALGFNAVHLYSEIFDINYPNPGSQAPGYAASRIDRMVEYTRDLGMYLVMTIGNGANNGNYNLNYVNDFWDLYSERYADETHVMFEIQNEPVAWGPPYSSPNATPPGALDMEIQVYNTIRQNAPDTPVLLFSYAVLGGTGGANAALTDIRLFNQAVFGRQEVVWENIGVGFHGYAGSREFEIAADNIINAGYPCFQTEFHGGTWGGAYGLDVGGVAALERLKVSWLAFVYIPPTGVSDDVTKPESYSEPVIRSGLSWKPDFGSFPEIRGVYGNNGYPWTTPGYTNNSLSASLRIQAENFDNGGKGIAYYNANTDNPGGQYRLDETVGIEGTSDSGGGYNVGWVAAGDWLEYTMNISTAGTYELKLRVASTNSGKVQVSSWGDDKTGEWTMPNTGGWQTWQTVSKTVFFQPGQQKLRLNFLTDGLNVNWIEITPVSTGVIPNGDYKILNAATAQALDLNSENEVIVADHTGQTVQQWRLRHIGGHQYQVSSVARDRSWYSWAGPLRLKTWGWGAGGDDCYIFRPAGNGYYYFYSAGSGRPYSPATGSDAPGLDTDVWQGFTSQLWAIVPPSAPVFPTGLSVLAVSSDQVDLSWNAVSGATGYNVKRSSVSGGPYTTIATNINTTSYTDSISSDTKYYYVVSALSGGNESANSMEATVAIPYPWATGNVGSVGYDGLARFDEGVFTIAGSGSDIWGSSDGFRYAYLPVTGDCSIVARVASVQDTDGWAKAGVMIRESLDNNSRNAFVAVTPGNGVTWQYRSSTGGNTSNANTTGLAAPYWVRLDRSGNTFRGYRSTDGVNWTQQGSANVSMASTVYIGLAVTSHNNSRVCSAVFDSVTVPGWEYIPVPVVPGNLMARSGDGYIDLSWTESVNAISYNVKRATVSGGPYTNIAEGIPSTNYRDIDIDSEQTYYYVVSALSEDGESGDSLEATALDIYAYLKFNQTTGTVAADSTGNGWDGTVAGTATWTTGKYKNGIDLDGNSGHITLPSGVVSSLTDDYTIATWVNLDASSGWSRIFDFGTGTNVNMFLTPSAGGGAVRFAITTGGSSSEQQITGGSALPTGLWTHVAVTKNGTTGILYVNGVEVGRNDSMTLSPADLGNTNQNYIGRSQYPDPYLNGRVDEFRIYSSALSNIEVAVLANLTTVNESPYFTSSPIVAPNGLESESYSYFINSLAVDPDGDDVTFSKVSGPQWLSVSESGEVSGTPSQDYVGENNFVVRVHDAEGFTNIAELSIFVADLHDGSQGMVDLIEMASHWLMADCVDLADCGGVDLNGDHKVDMEDFAVLAGNWLFADLKFHLKFDETTGTTATDSSLGGNDGILINGPVWTPGKVNGALDFDGVDDHVISQYQGIAGTTPRTVAAFIKVEADPGNVDKNLRCVLSWGSSVLGDGAKWFIAIDDSTGKLALGTYSARLVGGETLEDGQWHHISLVLPDGATNINQVKMYVDGLEVQTNADQLDSEMNTALSDVCIGGMDSSGIGFFFNGSIDDVRMYDVALTPEMISNLAQ